MKLKFGLDLGTNSIGLAVIDEAENVSEKNEIKVLTSRILPDDEDIRKMTENFLKGQSMSKDTKGKAISKNAKRREARGARRMNQRYLQRKRKLISFLKDELTFLPKEFPLHTDTNEIDKYFIQLDETEKKILSETFIVENAKHHNANIGLFNYYLREEALKRELKKSELARIFYQLNQKRGFKSNRKDQDNIEEETPKKKKKEPLSGIVKKVTLLRICEPNKKKIVFKEYEIEMVDSKKGIYYQLESKPSKFKEEAEVLFDLILKKDKVSKKEYTIIKWRERSAWENEMLEINEALKNCGKTVGQYFFNQLTKNPFYRIKDKKILREFYEAEFDAICNFQKQFHVQLTHTKISKLRNEIIFFQRHWGQANDLDQCRFEYKEIKNKRYYNKVCPRSNPIFQEFRTWQQIQNTKVFNKYEKEILLSVEDKEWLYEKLDTTKTLKEDSLLAAFQKRNNEIVRISWKKAIAGNQTKIDFENLFEEYCKKCLADKTEIQDFNNNYTALLANSDRLYLLWQMCYSIGIFTKDEKENLINALTSNKAFKNLGLKFTKQLAELFANSNNLKYERKHTNLSSLAIKKLLPFMKCGKYFDPKKIIDLKTKERINKIINAEFDEDISDTIRERLYGKSELTEFNNLNYWEAAYIVYGSHSSSEISEYKNFEDIKPLPQHSLRNPIAEQVINEALSVVKAAWRDYGKPAEIRVELTRELKQTADDRKNMFEAMNKGQEKNLTIIKELKKLGISVPSKFDIWAYKSFFECGQYSLYTNKKIELEEVFGVRGKTKLYDLDHVLPGKKFHDESFQNRMICELSVNRDIKKNMTAFEYVRNANNPNWTLENYVDKLNTLYNQKLITKQKKKYLLMESADIPDDFINRQKQDTAYISTRIIEELKKITPVVTTTTGSITDWLRKEWGLIGILEKMNHNRIIEFEKFIKLKFEESKIDLPDNFSIIEKQIIKGDKEIERCLSFTKRNDHRHHAIDALVVACTRQSYIQYLNTLNAQYDSTKIPKKYRGDKQAFLKDIAKPPKELWNGFHNDAENAINNIIVSVKDRKRLFTTSKNIITKKNYATNQIETIRIDSSNKAPRGKLHDETFYGSIQVPMLKYISKLSIQKLALQYSDEHQRAEFIKEANKHILEEEDLQNIVKSYIKNKLLQRFEESKSDFKKFVKSIEENPITYTNKKEKKITLLYASVFQKEIVYRKGLAAYFIENRMSKTTILNKLKRVVDKGVRQLLLDFFEDTKEWNVAEIKKHLNDPNGIIWFNEEMQIPIESVRIFNDKPDSKIPLYYNDSRKTPKRNTNLYIAPSNNYEYIVYEKLNKNGDLTGKREFETVTMFDAVRGIKDSMSSNLKYLFSLQQNDTIYFPDTDEDVLQTDFKNLNKIKDKLFTVAKFSQNGRIYFIPLSYADGINYLHIDDRDLKPIAEEIKDIKKKAIQEEIRTDNADIKNRCIKVEVDILGSKCVPYFNL